MLPFIDGGERDRDADEEEREWNLEHRTTGGNRTPPLTQCSSGEVRVHDNVFACVCVCTGVILLDVILVSWSCFVCFVISPCRVFCPFINVKCKLHFTYKDKEWKDSDVASRPTGDYSIK